MLATSSQRQGTGTLPKREFFPESQAWGAHSLRPEQWRLALDDECRRELGRVVDALRRDAKPAEAWSADKFSLPACQRVIDAARKLLDEGPGLVAVSRVPVEKYTAEENKTLYWLLGQLLDRPMPQYLEGYMIYDLRHVGVAELDNEQGARVKTDEILPHSDESLLNVGPKYISLFCLQKAKSGGETRLSSFYRAYNRLLDEDPALLQRLHEPFYWLPARQVPEGAMYYHPIIRYETDHLRFQHSEDYVHIGYKRWNKTLDDLGRRAARRLTEMLTEDQFGFLLEPGDFTFFHNDKVAHGRSFHTDFPELERKRHLLRLWLGETGSDYPLPAEVRTLQARGLCE